jgi:ubiquinone/menaquinone biosynthesis C-methylase UbiE
MLREGWQAAQREGLTNVKFLKGAAEDLPYLDSVFRRGG